MPSKSVMRLALPLVFILLVGLGCSLADIPLPFWPFQPVVQFINHPEPNLASEIQPFLEAGCAQQTGYPYVTCPVKVAPFAEFGCTTIRPATRLGALEPDLPIMLCSVNNPDRSETQPNVYMSGCLMRQYNRYLVFQDGKFKLVASLEEFRALYGPIESPDEALSYALAVTGLGAQYNLKADVLRYKVNQIEDTHVEQTGDGYKVHLFYYQLCGCGPHGTSAVQVTVSRAGEVQQSAKTLLFEDPKQDGMCVD